MYLATGWKEKEIHLFSVEENYRLVGSLPGHECAVTCFALTDDVKKLASGDVDHRVKVWDIESKTEIAEIFLEVGIPCPFRWLNFCPNNEDYIIAGDKLYLRLMHIPSQSVKSSGSVFCSDFCKESGKAYRTLPKTNKLATITIDFEKETLNTERDSLDITGSQERLGSQCPNKGIHCIAVNNTGSSVAVGYGNTSIKLFSLETGSEKRVLWGHSAIPMLLSFSEDSTASKLASIGRMESTIVIWNVFTGWIVTRIECGLGNYPWSIAFNPSGDGLATSQKRMNGKVTLVVVYNYNNGDEITQLERGNGPCIRYSKQQMIML
jgi:WD40 repeat protein